MKLEGRQGIVTGSNRGLGLAIAEALVEEGASVILAARDEALLETARAKLQTQAKLPRQRILAFPFDLGSEASIETLLEKTAAAFGSLHFLVNNAGIHGAIGALESADWAAWKEGIQVNLLGNARLIQLAIPLLKKAAPSQIINLSGGGASSPRPGFSSYASAKTAIVRLSETLAEELQVHRISVNAIAPGALNTRLLEEQLAAGPERLGTKAYEEALKQKEKGGASPRLAAELCAWLLSPDAEGISGKLLSAPWDPWRDLGKQRDALRHSDVYTLRRVLPKERGLDF